MDGLGLVVTLGVNVEVGVGQLFKNNHLIYSAYPSALWRSYQLFLPEIEKVVVRIQVTINRHSTLTSS